MNTKTKALLAFTIIFIVGFASGYLFNGVFGTPGGEYVEQQADRGEDSDRRLRFRSTDRSERSDRLQLRIRDRLAERLDLRAEQQEPFFDQMSEYRSTLRNSMRDMRNRESEQIREHYHAFRSDISTILTKSQLQKLDSQLHPDSVRQYRWRRVRPDRN